MTAISDLPPTSRPRRWPGRFAARLYAARDAGEIVELSRGVFVDPTPPAAGLPDLLAVTYRSPRAIVCLLSAAAVHDLTDGIPAVQITVPKSSRPPRITFPPTTVFRFDPSTFELAFHMSRQLPHEPVRIFGPERTVIDLMRLRHRIWNDGIDRLNDTSAAATPGQPSR